MRRLWIGIGALAIIAVFFFFYPFYPVLRIKAVKTERVYLCARMAQGEEFILSFIHSVNKRPVYDTIRVQGDHFIIVKSRFDSFGAGMPEGSHIGKDGWLEGTVNRLVPELTLFVGRVANHSLHLKGQEIPLARLAEAGTLLSLRIQKASRYQEMSYASDAKSDVMPPKQEIAATSKGSEPAEREAFLKDNIVSLAEAEFPDNKGLQWKILGFEHKAHLTYVEVEPTPASVGYPRLKFAITFNKS